MKDHRIKKMLALFILAIASFSACTTTVQDNQTISNPASTYCEQQGGTVDITDTPTGQRTDCVLTDGSRCDEWEYYRGDCPKRSSECGACPRFAPMAPNFCTDGKIIPGAIDECGCRGTPKCVREDDTTRPCTEEAKICPDGTSVGRTGPDCEFAACPEDSGVAGTEERNLCADPRPEMCTLQYDPVCGTSENQVQCIRAPCPPIKESKTYGNNCQACADKNVLYWTTGECRQ